MADKQSREVFEKDTLYVTDDMMKAVTGGNGDNSVRLRNGGTKGDITLKVDVDVSEALTGLKALQREAREATKALRELENAQEAYDWRKVACDNITRAIKDAEGDG